MVTSQQAVVCGGSVREWTPDSLGRVEGSEVVPAVTRGSAVISHQPNSKIRTTAGACGDCRQEVRERPSPGQAGRRLLLLAREPLDPAYFNYSDVLQAVNGRLLRLQIPLSNSPRRFLPFRQSSQTRGKLVNFENRILTASHYNCPPLLFKNSGWPTRKCKTCQEIQREHPSAILSCLEDSLLMLLSKKMNFQVKYLRIEGSNHWGTEDNGTWVGGIIGSLHSKDSDIGLCGVWMKYSQIKYVDLSTPYGQIKLGFVVLNTGRTENWKSIFHPLSPSLWLAVFISVLLSFICMFVLSKLSRKRKGPSDWLLTVVGQVLGGQSVQYSGPGAYRAAGCLVSCLGLVLGVAYSCSIVSHLASPPPARQPTTIRDLVLGGYLWSRARPVEDPGALLSTQDEWQSQFIRRYTPLEKLQPTSGEPKWAFFLSYVAGLVGEEMPAITNGRSVTLLREDIGHHHLGFGFQKYSPLVHHFSDAISQLLAAGVIAKMCQDVARINESSRMSTGELNTENKPLSLGALQGAFCLYVCGQIIATITFVIEILVIRYTKHPHERRKILTKPLAKNCTT